MVVHTNETGSCFILFLYILYLEGAGASKTPKNCSKEPFKRKLKLVKKMIERFPGAKPFFRGAENQ